MPAEAIAIDQEEAPRPVSGGGESGLEASGFRFTRFVDEGAGECREFESDTLVLCLNVAGHGEWNAGGRVSCPIAPGKLIVSTAPRARQRHERSGEGRHRAVILEVTRAWVKRWMPTEGVREPVSRFASTGRRSQPACESHAMTAQLAQLAAELLQPPRGFFARACWRQAKALEIASHALFADDAAELFCERTKRAGRERILRVQEILRGDLENPPSLAELGKMVGCSPFYLSRMFRQETGVTISACLRRLRLDRAAELLRAGEANVTEAAVTVGYSSLSHFSKAFAETFGCCPCLFGRKG